MALVAANVLLLLVLAASDAVAWSAPGRTLAAVLLALATALGTAALLWRLTARLAAANARSDAVAARQREILDALEVGLVVYDRDDRLVLANRDFRNLYAEVAAHMQPGDPFEALLRRAVAHGAVPEAAADPEAWIAERVAAHRQPAGPILRQLPGGRWRRIVEQRLADGSLLAHSVDVSALVHKEQALAAARSEAELARQRLDDAIQALPDAFALYDAEDRLVTFNQRYAEVYQHSAPALVPGTHFEAVLRFGLARGQYPQAAGREQAWLAERLHAHRHPGAPLLQELPDNRWLRIDERRTRDGGIAGVRSDVTELVRREQDLRRLNARLDGLNAELARLSDTDPLTGLANRRHFDRRLASEWTRAQRHGMQLALVLLDVDHFKAFNDHHGHPAGDACLRQVATLLAGVARRPTDLVARIGGEEFAVLLPHQNAADADAVARRCIATLDEAAIAHGASPVAAHVTCSAGVADAAVLGAAGDSAQLLSAADGALYQAKQSGRRRSARAATA